jgi:hypothetical protein
LLKMRPRASDDAGMDLWGTLIGAVLNVVLNSWRPGLTVTLVLLSGLGIWVLYLT